MTGYQSKKAAALDEDGMYLVHHTKRKVNDDDDIQVYKRPWVGLTDEDEIDWDGGDLKSLIASVEAKLKEKNT